MIPAAGAHGGDGPAIARALGIDVLDLSASLNPVAPDVAGLAARHLGALRSYPDPAEATAALARAMDVDPGRLVLTNGGAEAIALVGAELGGSVTEPDFALYPRSGGPRWRSNPHSPSGLLAAPDEEAGVWDEAFWPLATGTWTRGDGTWVVGSLTKLFACPGLRIGYALAPTPGDADVIRHRRPAWSVNGLACSLLGDLLDLADLPGWAKETAELRHALVEVLRGAGLDTRPSDANWVLVDAPGLRDRLAHRGVAVRDCASFGMPGVVRIAVPDDDGRDRVRQALAS